MSGQIIESLESRVLLSTSTEPGPVAVDDIGEATVVLADRYETDEDTPLFVARPGVLANDVGSDGPLTATPDRAPAHGELTDFSPDGGFRYVPERDFFGVDAFTYRAIDGRATSEPVAVTITVRPIADAPVARPNDYRTAEDTPLVVSAAAGLLGNDVDPDGDRVSAVLEAGPVFGSLALDEDGGFRYIPGRDFSGTDSFTYRASDGRLASDPATVTIAVAAVNDTPVAADDEFATDQGMAVAGNVLANDRDPDTDPLAAALVSAPTRGSVQLNADGSFVYTPRGDFSGRDSFTYVADDRHGGSDLATVVVSVHAAPNRPPTASDDAATTVQRNAVTVAVLANDADPDGQRLSVVGLTRPAHGSVSLNPDNTVTYTPSPDYSGLDSFQYTIGDGQGGLAAATVNVMVLSPVAAMDSLTATIDRYQRQGSLKTGEASGLRAQVASARHQLTKNNPSTRQASHFVQLFRNRLMTIDNPDLHPTDQASLDEGAADIQAVWA